MGTLTYFNSNTLHNCEERLMRLNLQMMKLKVKRNSNCLLLHSKAKVKIEVCISHAKSYDV